MEKVGRPNLMIKIPATEAGLPAIRQLIGEGINVNITLLFGLPSYRQVVDAYLAGLETLAAQGKPLDRSASVASFFLSRIDTLADPILKKIRLDGGPRGTRCRFVWGVGHCKCKSGLPDLSGNICPGSIQKLAQKGARTQRLLWASTSTKNPKYSDVKYVEPLIGRDTINTLPLETIHLYRDHGSPALSLEDNVEQAYQKLDQLGLAGLDMNFLTKQLEDEGVEKFEKAFETLMSVLGEKREAAMKKTVER